MKTLTKEDFIGSCAEIPSITIYEQLNEMPMLRYKEFRERVIRAFEDAEVPTVSAYNTKIMDAINSKELYRIVVIHDSYVRATKRSEINSLDLAFSLLCLEPCENEMNISDQFHRDKMQRIIHSGIRAEVFAREVYFFMARHIIEFRGFGNIIQMLFEMSNQGSSKEPI